MLRIFVNLIEKLEEGSAAVIATIRRIKAEIHEALDDFDSGVDRTYNVDFEPVTAISSDAPVLQPAASKGDAPPDVAKLKGKKLRAHADELGVEYHPTIGDPKLRARILEGVE
jgi:hypothetical protein